MGLISSIKSRRTLISDALRTQLWPVPLVALVFAIVAGIGLSELDQALIGVLPGTVTTFLFGGGPGAARETLGSIASSLITVTALTFSLTLVTLQQASGQFSPRLLRTFAGDRFVQRTLALFVATFVFALTVLRTVRSGSESGANFVPRLSVTVAFLLALASVIVLVLFLAHLVREIRVETMVTNVHCNSLASVCEQLPQHRPDRPADQIPSPPPHATSVLAPSSGFLVRVDEQSLLDAATDAAAIVLVDREPGESVVAGTPVAAVWPQNAHAFDEDVLEKLCGEVKAAVHTGHERTPVQDVGYGLRQLTDVALKALSPGINDPTTAIHSLGYSASLLCEMADRDVGPAFLRDEDDVVRVVLLRPDLPALLDVAISQPRHYGASDAALLSRLFWLLRELAWCTTQPAHQAAISDQLVRLQRTVLQEDFDQTERAQLDELGHAVEAALEGKWRG